MGLEPMRTLLIGVGARGKIWSRILDDEPMTHVVGYVDLLDHNLEWVRDRYDATSAMCYRDMNQALRELRPELVLLATPPMDRYREVISVFEHGAHLLSEKPLTLRFDEGIRIVQAAEDAQLGFSVGLNFRYQHCVTTAHEILRSGEIGRPSFARFTYWINRDGRRPGGNTFPLTMHQPMLYEQTIHHFDEIRYVYGAEVERVWCRCHNPPWSMYRDDATVAALLELEGDLLVDYFGTWSGQTKVNEFLWRTDCQNGALFQHEMFADLRIARGTSATEVQKLELPEQERLVDDARVMLRDVVAQLRDGHLRPHPSGVDHLKTFGLIAACEESDTTGQPVVMREFFERHSVPAEWLDDSAQEGK
jgi:predicted dehydrogenase